MNIMELLLGQIPEAIYFTLFVIFAKELKSKRIMFILLEIIEYVFLFQYALRYNVYAHVVFFILTFCVMKILYKDKCNITDIFTLGIASVVMIIVSVTVYFPISVFTTNTIIGNYIQKILLFLLLIVFRKYLPKINVLYNKLWNRSKHRYKMKSTTFRALNLVVFNIMFYIINIGMLYYYLMWRR